MESEKLPPFKFNDWLREFIEWRSQADAPDLKITLIIKGFLVTGILSNQYQHWHNKFKKWDALDPAFAVLEIEKQSFPWSMVGRIVKDTNDDEYHDYNLSDDDMIVLKDANVWLNGSFYELGWWHFRISSVDGWSIEELQIEEEPDVGNEFNESSP